MVIMQDPDTGWINYGAYRVQSHGPNVATVMCSKGKHGDLIKRRYHERGEPCPVAVVVGMHPALFMVAGLEIPYGKNEYDVAGGLIGEPVEVIKGPRTGLPIPAQAEIAFEGFVHPERSDRRRDRSASGPAITPAARRRSRRSASRPSCTATIRSCSARSRACRPTTTRSIAAPTAPARSGTSSKPPGVPEVKGVWAHAAGGSRLWLTVAIKQQYGGHAKQAGLIASQCHAGAYANRVVVVVDDDIDPADMDQVVWAICTRFEPREGIEILRGCWSTVLDPMAYGSDDPRNARVVIDACKPWSRRDTFPIVARSSKELDARIRAKWAHVLPRG